MALTAALAATAGPFTDEGTDAEAGSGRAGFELGAIDLLFFITPRSGSQRKDCDPQENSIDEAGPWLSLRHWYLLEKNGF